MNYFQRWGSTPSFRRWWPILGPIYSPGFREFAKARFAVGVSDGAARADGGRFRSGAGLELREIEGRALFLASNLWREFKQRRPAPVLSGRSILAYELELLDYYGDPGRVKFQVGFVLVEDDIALRQMFERERIDFTTTCAVFRPLAGAAAHQHY